MISTIGIPKSGSSIPRNVVPIGLLTTTRQKERASDLSLGVGFLYCFRFRFHVDHPNATITNTTTMVEARWCDDAYFSQLFLPPVFIPKSMPLFWKGIDNPHFSCAKCHGRCVWWMMASPTQKKTHITTGAAAVALSLHPHRPFVCSCVHSFGSLFSRLSLPMRSCPSIPCPPTQSSSTRFCRHARPPPPTGSGRRNRRFDGARGRGRCLEA
jgi:hypothetical protein